MTYLAKIEKILCATTKYAIESGKFDRFKVETRITTSEPWKVCKGEYSIEGPWRHHEVKCNNPTIAKYIRLSVAGGVNLYLSNVEVVGSLAGVGKICIFPRFEHFLITSCYRVCGDVLDVHN